MEICFNVIKFSLIIICMVFLHTVQTECNCLVNVLQHLGDTGGIYIFAGLLSPAIGVFNTPRKSGQQEIIFYENGGFGPQELQQPSISSNNKWSPYIITDKMQIVRCGGASCATADVIVRNHPEFCGGALREPCLLPPQQPPYLLSCGNAAEMD